LPYHELANELSRYKNADICWVQEEHKNQGAWNYIEPRIENLLYKLGIKLRTKYIGRKSSSTSGTGYYDIHEKELSEFLGNAFE
jgi:2-oxoglutarate dehydrogenase E1 component